MKAEKPPLERPPIEWLNKLDATCEKIQKKMTAQFFEKLDEAERENRNNTDVILEGSNIERVNDINQTGSRTKTQKQSRWDVKPEYDFQEDDYPRTEKNSSKSDGKIIPSSSSVSENRHSTNKGLDFIDLTEDVEERMCRQKTTRTKLREINEQDSDVEIVASTAGHNPLRRVRSQNQFVTLEEVNKSPFYKKFTSDNMILDSRAANLKYGTVFDLVKSKTQSSDAKHKKYSQRRSEDFSRRPSEENESWSYGREYENKKSQVNSFHNKTMLPQNKSQLINLVNDKAYDHLKTAVKFFGQTGQSNVASKHLSDESSLRNKFGKSCNEFQGKMPFYKQNYIRNSKYSYPEKSFTNHAPSDLLLPPPTDLYPASSETLPSNQNVADAQFNNVRYPQQACSFHCNCCKNTSYFPSMGASYQPPATCNYAFLHYLPNQPVISPPNKNLPTPFPTYAVRPPPPAALAASAPSYYSNTSSSGYSIPVFCNEGNESTNKTTVSHVSWNTSNSHHPEITCRNIFENTSRPKDPRTDMKDRVTQPTSNALGKFSSIESLSKNPGFSGISEERFSQSCTFLRPDNLYKDFKCHTDELGNNSLQSLKSFGLINNMTPQSISNKIGMLNKSDPKDISNNRLPCKIQESENLPVKLFNSQAEYQSEKQEGTVNILGNKLKHPPDNYTSPLSNLYNDTSDELKGYSNATNKHFENRKRKSDFLCRNFISSDNRKRNIGKVEPMTKLSHDQNKECLTPNQNQNLENTSILKNQESKQCDKIENSPRIHSANHSNEHLGKIKSPKEWVEKDYKPYQTSSEVKDIILNESACKGLLLSEKIEACSKDCSVSKCDLLESDTTLKKAKEQKRKSCDSRTCQSRSSKNTHDLEKQKPIGKDKLLPNNIYSKKDASSRMNESCSNNIKIISCEKNECFQKENIGIEVEIENTSFYKSFGGDLDSSFYAPSNLLPPENIPVPKKRKLVGNEKIPESKTLNKSVSDLKKCISSQNHQLGISTEKETCSKKNNFSDKLTISKNQDDKKASLPEGEISNIKDKSSERILVPLVANKDPIYCTTPQQSKIFTDKNVKAEKTNSVIRKNKDNNKISAPQKGENFSEKYKCSVKPTYSKKTSKHNSNNQSNIFSQQEDLVIQEAKLDDDSLPKTVNRTESKQLALRKINTIRMSISRRTSSKSNDKCSERKIPSRKRNIDKIKDCSVVLERKKSVSTENCIYNNNAESTDPKHFASIVMSPKRIQTHDMKTVIPKNGDSQSDNSKSTKNKEACPRQKPFDKEKNTLEEIPNYDSDKVKDLVLRMKSLSQSEALKVLSEFAFTLKDDSQQNISKNHEVSYMEEETEQIISQIKIKEETKDDIGPLEVENNINDGRNDCPEVFDNTAKTMIHNTLKSNSALLQEDELNQFKTCENKGERITVIDESDYVKSAIIEIDIKNCHTSFSKVTEAASQKPPKNLIPLHPDHKDKSEKLRFNKKKKLSELEKIHADLESFHGLDDIMKCSGFRTCRLKNESSVTSKESATEDKQNKKRRVTEPPEESFFIQDEITIKMEPIPDLTFDFIKQEPDYFE